MKVKSVTFKNYKSFYEKQTMKLKPITVLIGKNSSGKSSLAKLLTLIEQSLSGKINEPLLLNNNNVEIAEDFSNLFFGNSVGSGLEIGIFFENDTHLEIGIRHKGIASARRYGLDIYKWMYFDPKDDLKKIDIELEDDYYLDINKKVMYDCKFKGFILSSLYKRQTQEIQQNFEDLVLDLSKLSITVDYIGPFRILPERYFYLTGQTEFNYTGSKGEFAYAMLGISSKKEDKLCEQVGEWYAKHFDGWKLVVDSSSKRPLIQILLSKGDSNINIADVGQGMNQALPIVVRSYVNKPDSIIVIEQPELHLHPAAHGDLAELFVQSAKQNHQTFVLETHSENMILRLRKLVLENDYDFTPEDVIIYWLEGSATKGQELREISIDEEGVLSDWPEGVFNEDLKEVLEIQKILRRKQEN